MLNQIDELLRALAGILLDESHGKLVNLLLAQSLSSLMRLLHVDLRRLRPGNELSGRLIRVARARLGLWRANNRLRLLLLLLVVVLVEAARQRLLAVALHKLVVVRVGKLAHLRHVRRVQTELGGRVEKQVVQIVVVVSVQRVDHLQRVLVLGRPRLVVVARSQRHLLQLVARWRRGHQLAPEAGVRLAAGVEQEALVHDLAGGRRGA